MKNTENTTYSIVYFFSKFILFFTYLNIFPPWTAGVFNEQFITISKFFAVIILNFNLKCSNKGKLFK